MAERATGWVDKARVHWDTEAQAEASNAVIDLETWLNGESMIVAEMMGNGGAESRVVFVGDIIRGAAKLLPILAAYVKAQASNG